MKKFSKKRMDKIQEKVHKWDEENPDEFWSLRHALAFDRKPAIKELSEKGRRENKAMLARAVKGTSISLKVLKQWELQDDEEQEMEMILRLVQEALKGLSPEDIQALRK